MFFVELPVKPYVKQYIVLNYGNPANFSSNKNLYHQFRKYLLKPSQRYNSFYEKRTFCKYNASIKIIISQDDFYRHGWELSLTDIISFGKSLEHQAKFLMRNMVSFYMTFLNERDAITTFQNNFGFTEDIWPYDSMRKDYERFTASHPRISYTKDLSVKLENLLLVSLSEVGNLHPPAIVHYKNEKNK